MGILLPIIIAVLVLLMLLIVFVSKYQTKLKSFVAVVRLSYQCSNVQIELVCFQVN